MNQNSHNAKPANKQRDSVAGDDLTSRPSATVKLWLDQDVIKKFQKTGKQWRSKMNDVLKRAKI